MFRPDGTAFLSEIEMDELWQAERDRANAEHDRAERLALKLRQLGIADADA